VRIRFQVVWLLGARGFAGVLALGFFLLSSRRLGPDATGDLALIMALGAIASISAEFGLATFLTREVARHRGAARPLALLVLRRRVQVALIASAVMTVAYLVASKSADIRVPLVFSISVCASPLYGTVHAAQRAWGEVRPEAANELLSRAVALLLGWCFIGGGGVLTAVTILAFVDLVSGLAHLPLLRRLPHTEPAPALRLRDIAPIGVSTVLTAMVGRIDVWLATLLLGAAAAGFYGAARKIADGLAVVSQSFSTLAVAPLVHKEPEERRRLFVLFVGASIGAAGLLGAIPFLFAGRILDLVLGAEFVGAAGALRWSLVAGVAAAVLPVSMAATNVAAASRGPARLIVVVIVTVVAVAVGAAGGNPSHAAAGLAVAAIVSSAFVAVKAWADLGHAAEGAVTARTTPDVVSPAR
jgi:O-antigen/teichoic acid export membrane protein